MAVFNKNSLSQVSGFSNPIIAGELVWNQQTFWNLNFTDSQSGDPIDLTGATIDAQIVRRNVTNVRDSRNGLTFDIADYSPPPTPVALTITNLLPASGSFTLLIDSNAWNIMASDPGLDISAVNPVGFSGRIKVTQASSGNTPVESSIIFLFFLVRSDGIVS